MLPIARNEVLSLGDYEQVRPQFRARVIAEKRARRVSVGPHMTVTFENRDTVLLQIQEMLRTERITQEHGILHEIETYNDLLPSATQLSMTLFIEVPEKNERERILTELAGLEERVLLEIAGKSYRAFERDRSVEGIARTTAVHYYKVDLDDAAVATIRAGGEAFVVIDHERYPHKAKLEKATLVSLSRDFT